MFPHLLLFTFEGDFDAFDGDLDVDFPLLHRLGFEIVLSTAEQKSSDYGLKGENSYFSGAPLRSRALQRKLLPRF